MRTYANTLSVLLTGSLTLTAYLRIGKVRDDMENSCNVTVRFDRGAEVMVCGYPMSWGVWDVNVDYYDPGSPTYEECDDKPEFYVSRDVEVKLLRAVIRDIKRQSVDTMFSGHVTLEYRTECIRKISRRIRSIRGVVKQAA